MDRLRSHEDGHPLVPHGRTPSRWGTGSQRSHQRDGWVMSDSADRGSAFGRLSSGNREGRGVGGDGDSQDSQYPRRPERPTPDGRTRPVDPTASAGEKSPRVPTGSIKASSETGISLFDGKIIATPTRATPPPRSARAERSLRGIDHTALAHSQRGARSLDAESTGSGGFSRFQPLLRSTAEDEEGCHGSGYRASGSATTNERPGEEFPRGSSGRPEEPLGTSSVLPSKRCRDMESPSVVSARRDAPRYDTPLSSADPRLLEATGDADFTASPPLVNPTPESTAYQRKEPRNPTTRAPLAPSLASPGAPRPRTPTAAPDGSTASARHPLGPSKRNSKLPPSPATPGERTWPDARRAAQGPHGGHGGGPARERPKSPRARKDGPTTAAAAAAPGRKSASASPRPCKPSRPLSPRARDSSAGPPPPRRLTLADFAGADEVCFNPGGSASRAGSGTLGMRPPWRGPYSPDQLPTRRRRRWFRCTGEVLLGPGWFRRPIFFGDGAARRVWRDAFRGVCFRAGPPHRAARFRRERFDAPRLALGSGASTEALGIFLERCEARGIVALAMLWADLTTSFSAVTVKGCTPSQSCHRWNCACGRQVWPIRSCPSLGL